MKHQISNTNNTPFFPISEPQHFSDYGFDPQIDYFQVLEEARKQKIRDHHFKLQKPTIHRDDSSKKIKKNKKRWWTNALHFFKSRKWAAAPPRRAAESRRIGSISGPIYVTESRSGSRTASRAGSGQLLMREEMENNSNIPYISLREVNMDHQTRKICATNATMPIYLVT